MDGNQWFWQIKTHPGKPGTAAAHRHYQVYAHCLITPRSYTVTSVGYLVFLCLRCFKRGILIIENNLICVILNAFLPHIAGHI